MHIQISYNGHPVDCQNWAVGRYRPVYSAYCSCDKKLYNLMPNFKYEPKNFPLTGQISK